MMRLIKVDGTETVLPEKFNFDEVTKHIGGYILPYRLKGKDWFLMDEDGEPKNLPINKKATDIFRKFYGNKLNYDYIRGNVIITDEFE